MLPSLSTARSPAFPLLADQSLPRAEESAEGSAPKAVERQSSNDQEHRPSLPERGGAESSNAGIGAACLSARGTSSNNLGTGFLKRLASYSSSRSKDEVDPSPLGNDRSPIAMDQKRRSSQSSSSPSHHRLSKAELAELSRPKGKFKSAARWDPQDVPEPFMEVSAFAVDGEGSAALKDGVITNAMLTSASTAAARSYVENRSLGEPIFATASGEILAPTTSSSRGPGVPSVVQTLAAVTQSGVTAGILAETNAALNLSSMPDRQASLSKDPIASTTDLEVSPSRSSSDQKMVAEAAQRVLEAARKQARAEQSRKGLSVPASPQTQSSPVLPGSNNEANRTDRSTSKGEKNEASTHDAESSSGKAGSKGKAGRGKGIIGTIKDKRGKKSRSRKNSSVAGPTTPGGSEPGAGSGGTNSPSLSGGTGRRRRYNDTRDLDLLAYELAAEALASGMPEPPFARTSRSGASSPRSIGQAYGGALSDNRRRSFHSTASGSDTVFNASQTSLANLMMQPMTAMNPEMRSREASFSGPTASSQGTPSTSLPGSPPMVPSDVMQGDSKPEGFSAASSPYMNKASDTMPVEMMPGLGGSPYPSLSRKVRDPLDGIDNLDPFGIPLSHESPFDVSAAYVNRTHVYHTPTQVAHSRNRMVSPSSGNGAGRKSVLQMKMHDPESEMQGLTKMPKKKLTPFGSRANSRGPSPNPSSSNLRESAKVLTTSKGSMEKETQMADSNPSRPTSRRPSIGAPEKLQGVAPQRNGRLEAADTANGHPELLESGSQVATPRAEQFSMSKEMTVPESIGNITEKAADQHIGLPSPNGTAAAPAPSETDDKSSRSDEMAASKSDSRSPGSASLIAMPTPKPTKRLSSLFGLTRKKEKDANQAASQPDSSNSSAHHTKESESPPRTTGRPGTAHSASVSRSTAIAATVSNTESRSAHRRSMPPLSPSVSPQLATVTPSNGVVAVGADQGGAKPMTSTLAAESKSSVSKAASSTVGNSSAPDLPKSPKDAGSSAGSASAQRSNPGNLSTTSSRSTTNDSKKGSQASSATDRSASSGGGNVRRFLRRLSSFGASSSGSGTSISLKKNSAKDNFPDASTMPNLDHAKLAKAGYIADRGAATDPDAGDSALIPGGNASHAPNDIAAVPAASDASVSPHTIPSPIAGADASPVRSEHSFQTAEHDDRPSDSPAPAASPAMDAITKVDEVMARSGFGTSSAYVYSVLPPQQPEAPGDSGVGGGAQRDITEEQQPRGRVVNGMSGRPDLRTASSEDSTFLSSGNSYASGPSSGELPSPGQEVDVNDESQEVVTPASSAKSLDSPVAFDSSHFKPSTDAAMPTAAPAIVGSY